MNFFLVFIVLSFASKYSVVYMWHDMLIDKVRESPDLK